jgi:hypothetical protein
MDDATHGDESQGNVPDDAASAAAGRAGLLAQLRQLEDFAARTVREGDALPPQATEMILHLREIVQALDGLTASMTEEHPPADESAAPDRGQPEDETGGAA